MTPPRSLSPAALRYIARIGRLRRRIPTTQAMATRFKVSVRTIESYVAAKGKGKAL